MVIGNMKVQTGMRVDKVVFDRFKELCRGERLLVGEAVERLMEACLEAGSVTAILMSQAKGTVAQSKADELKLKGALANLKGFIRAVEKRRWYVTVSDRETRIDQAVYRPAYETAVATLPKIQDAQLIREAEQVLEKANRCVEKIVG